ncbi:MAG: metallophosphoesterase [Sulfolobales archaeon]|nr:metallophosphoesterase [Sulfolobales archaeon]MDW8083094.1 metallophosphoesterase [Sulfolobales archaeon]
MPGLETVGELPAVYMRTHRILILADTHIGFEEEISSKGGYIPRFQLKNTLRILEEAFSSVSVDRVIFAGDIKHLFNTLGRLEKLELAELLTYVKKHVEDVVVVRGNHDNFLPAMRKRFDFEIVDSFLLPPFIVVHGHKQLGEELSSQSWSYLIMGHEHPSIALRDTIGFIGKFSCFLVGNMLNYGKKVVVLPAVGIYQTGSKVTLTRDTYLSPIMREYVDIETLKPVVVTSDIGVLEFPALRELHDIMIQK